jgi:dynein heavy chain
MKEALSIVSGEMRDSLTFTTADGATSTRAPSWTGIRFLLAELVYGSFLSDSLDQLSLTAMVDYWISPNAVKRDFELPRRKWCWRSLVTVLIYY